MSFKFISSVWTPSLNPHLYFKNLFQIKTKTWLSSRLLKLNMSKSELMTIPPPQHHRQKSPFMVFLRLVDETSIIPVTDIKNLNDILDSIIHIQSVLVYPTFKILSIILLKHIKNLAISDYFYLCHAVQDTIISHLDYCNRLSTCFPASTLALPIYPFMGIK